MQDIGASCLSRAFFARDSVTVARALLGQRLVRVIDGERLSGLISETEAYGGPDDEASHAFRRTRRSAIMYGPPGYAYVYFIYGMYFCLNGVTEQDGRPGAVLIRAIVSQEGIEAMRARRRGVPDRQLADGPGKLCMALDIGRALNGADLTAGRELFIEAGPAIPDEAVLVLPRVGVRGNHDARTRPWRFLWRPTAQAGSSP